MSVYPRSRDDLLNSSLAWVVTVLTLSSGALADVEVPMSDDSWRIYVGAFAVNASSEIRINAETRPVRTAKIRVEDVFGVDDGKWVGWGGIDWKIAERHLIELEVLTLHRSASELADFTPPIQLGDLYLESGQIATSYDTDVIRLTYNYAWHYSDRAFLHSKIGVHWARLKAGFTLRGMVCSPDTAPKTPPGCPPLGFGAISEDVSTPLLHIGLSYNHALTESVAFSVSAMGFALEVNDIEGGIVEFDADVGWQPFRHVGFGLGVRYFKTSVESKGSRLNGAFDFEYFGPVAFVQATF